MMSRRLFSTDEAWADFLSSSRTQVVASICALHSSFTPVNLEFYGWTTIDSHTQKKVTFRAPSAQKDLLLAASGVHTPFIINLVCRDDTSRNARDSTSSVLWLGKLGFTDSLAWIKQIDGHLGLVLSKQSFGIRCAPASLDTVPRLVSPTDSKFTDSNIKIRGVLRFIMSGLPVGCSRSEIIKRFAEWKVGDTTAWAVIPVKHWTTSGQCHWLVRADVAPPTHFYLCKSGRILIQLAPAEQFAPKPRAPTTPGPSSQAPRSKSKQQPPEPSTVNPSPALLARVVAVESGLDTLEARSSNLEAQLQNGFSQILARLMTAALALAALHKPVLEKTLLQKINAASSPNLNQLPLLMPSEKRWPN